MKNNTLLYVGGAILLLVVVGYFAYSSKAKAAAAPGAGSGGTSTTNTFTPAPASLIEDLIFEAKRENALVNGNPTDGYGLWAAMARDCIGAKKFKGKFTPMQANEMGSNFLTNLIQSHYLDYLIQGKQTACSMFQDFYGTTTV